jgi:hypothetical protein
VDSLQSQIGTINIALRKHDDQLIEHERLITKSRQGLEQLEQKVSAFERAPSVNESQTPARPTEIVSPSTLPGVTAGSSHQKFHINEFSDQEKKILAVFFHNKDMRLSYADLAQALHKSPHTVKNQMNRMRVKADLFEKTTGDQSRNRFKLKDSLRIEKFLNVGRPSDHSTSTITGA